MLLKEMLVLIGLITYFIIMSYFKKLTKANQVSKFQNLKYKMHSKSGTVCTVYTTRTTPSYLLYVCMSPISDVPPSSLCRFCRRTSVRVFLYPPLTCCL